MKFDTTRTFVTRFNDPIKVEDRELTSGWLAVFAIDNMKLDKADGKELRRRFRLAAEIQDATEKQQPLDIKSDELELLDELVVEACKRLSNGTNIYGQFSALLEDSK
jgi:hypothetical protein